MDGSKLRYGFLSNHHLLMRRLSTTSILPYVYSEGLVTDTEKGLIHHEVTEDLKTDRLLDIIHRLGNGNPSVYVQFFDLLSNNSEGQNLGEVLEKITNDSQSEEVARKFDYGRRLLEEDDHAALLKHKWTLVQSMSVEELLPELISLGSINMQEKDQIK